MRPLTNFIITIVILITIALTLLLVILGPLSLQPGHGAEIRSEKVLSDTATVIIENNTYNPSNLTVLAGTTVIWKNPSNSAQVQSVVSQNMSNGTRLFDSGPMNAGSTYNFTFAKVGKYSYGSGIQYFANGSINVVPNVPETFPIAGQGTTPQGYPTLASGTTPPFRERLLTSSNRLASSLDEVVVVCSQA